MADPHFVARGFPVEVEDPEHGRSFTYPRCALQVREVAVVGSSRSSARRAQRRVFTEVGRGRCSGRGCARSVAGEPRQGTSPSAPHHHCLLVDSRVGFEGCPALRRGVGRPPPRPDTMVCVTPSPWPTVSVWLLILVACLGAWGCSAAGGDAEGSGGSPSPAAEADADDEETQPASDAEAERADVPVRPNGKGHLPTYAR